MKPATLVSLGEYLNSSYRPDCDYLEGVVAERNVGEYDHARVQFLLSLEFGTKESAWGVICLPEQRVQVRPDRFRVPDLCLLRSNAPREQIVTHPPLLCVEILSRDDRMSDMQDRIDDYLAMGVSCVWIVNPRSRKGHIHVSGQSWEPKDGILCVEGSEIAVPLANLFAGL